MHGEGEWINGDGADQDGVPHTLVKFRDLPVKIAGLEIRGKILWLSDVTGISGISVETKPARHAYYELDASQVLG